MHNSQPDPNCIFCKIINKELPAQIVYEDENVIAFLDISPNVFGHTLVVPKQHTANFMELADEVISQIIKAAQKIAPAVLQATGAKGFNLITNIGKSSGQEIEHTHWHIIPRHGGDAPVWSSLTYADGELEVMGEKIRSYLN